MLMPTNILVPLDFSEYSREVLKQTVAFAQVFRARIYVLHVVEHKLIQCIDDYCLSEELIQELGASQTAQYTDDYSITQTMVKRVEDQMFSGSKANMDRLTGEISTAADVEIISEVRRGIPYQEIVNFQKEKNIDLIIMPSHGKGGLTDFHIGSTSEKVLRLSPCTVTIVKY